MTRHASPRNDSQKILLRREFCLGKHLRFALQMGMDDYDHKAQELSDANEPIFIEFAAYLRDQKKRTQKDSEELANAMRFYANEYVIHYQMKPLLQGLEYFESFVTDWFLRKCMWSSAETAKLNGQAYFLLLEFLDSKGHVLTAQVMELRENLDSIIELAVDRANAYNNPKIDVEELFDEYGCWNEALILKLKEHKTKQPLKAPQKPPDIIGAAGAPHLDVHVIVSAKAAKFLKLKPPQLVKLSEWNRDWKDPSIHWFSKWRCEECFSMQGTKARIFIVTNEASRYSFLLKLNPGDWIDLQSTLLSRMLHLLMERQYETPDQCSMQVHFLSGAVASLTTTQNHLNYYLDAIMDRETLPYLDDYEKPLNHYLTTIEGEYRYPEEEMARLLKENHPLVVPPEAPANVIPLWN